jgi:hypothetical protein
VDKAEDWEFSSYQEYIELRRGSLPKLHGLRLQFYSADAYRYFLEDSNVDLFIQDLTFEE